MSEPSAAMVRAEDVNALVGSNYWQPLKNGIRFELTEDGKQLVDPGKAAIFGIKDGKGKESGGLVGALDMFNTAFGWWAGDTANAIEILYGKEEVVHFAERIDNTIEYVGKLQSTSRSYGFPRTAAELETAGLKIEELRVEGLSHAHHQVMQGYEEPQRHKVLRKALALGWSKVELQEYRKRELEGKGQVDPEKKEYPVWHVAFPAFNKEADNPEEYVAKCQAMIPQEFPYYFDPEKAQERELEDIKSKAVDGLPDDLQASTLEAGKTLDGTKFKELAKAVKGRHNVFVSVEKYFTKKVKNETKRAEMIAGAKESGMSKEAAKQVVKAYNATLTDEQKAEKSIEQLVAKIKNPDTRKALLEQAASENLTKDQFEPIIQEAIAQEMLAEERAQLDDPEYLKKLQDKAKAKLAPPKPRKAQTKKKAGDDGLPLGKKAAAKTGGGKKGSGKKS